MLQAESAVSEAEREARHASLKARAVAQVRLRGLIIGTVMVESPDSMLECENVSGRVLLGRAREWGRNTVGVDKKKIVLQARIKELEDRMATQNALGAKQV